MESVETREKSAKKGGHRKLKIFLKILLITVLILMIAVSAVGLLGWRWLETEFDQMDRVKYNEKDLLISETARKNLNDYRNILLLGIDSREGENINRCRSDAMVLVSINKKTGDVKMVSIMRDSFLELEENGNKKIDKLTHAHAFGGPKNTIRALNKNLDLNIKEFIRVDWKAVADMADGLGGLELNVKDYQIKEMNKYIDDTNKSLHGDTSKIKKAGKQKLNGVQVVTFCRIRHVGRGDTERAERMREAMLAMISKATKVGIKKVDKMVDKVVPEITTNIDTRALMELLIKNLNVKIKKSIGWPYTWDGAMIGGVSYDVPITLETNVKDLYRGVFGIKNYNPTTTVKEISERVSKKSGYYKGQPVQITNKK